MIVVSSEQMRQMEQRAVDMGMPWQALMQNAGRAIADQLMSQLGTVSQKRVLVLVGPGNNGGDGLVVARHLHDAGAIVSLYLWNRQNEEDINLILAQDRAIPVINIADDPGLAQLESLVYCADIILDALLGTGRARPIGGTLRELLAVVRKGRQRRHMVVAVDLPSGMNPDDGGIDPNSLSADLTITLGCPKLGLLMPPGNAYTGELIVADIGIPAAVGQDIETKMITADAVRHWLPPRPASGNKGTFGKVMAVTGSRNYVGAAALTGAAAIRAGAGLVTIAAPDNIYPILAAKLTESTFLPLSSGEHGGLESMAADQIISALPGYNVLAIGPGLGQHSQITAFLRRLLTRIRQNQEFATLRCVVDADGLNNLRSIDEWWNLLPDQTILTPHPGELARLLNLGVPDVQRDRLNTVRKAAIQWRKVVALKGANSIIAGPDGRVSINPGATAALASAGTGDVLTGLIAGLLAQDTGLHEAAASGVYIHWRAAMANVAARTGVGLAAGDLVQALPEALYEISNNPRLTR